MKDTLLRRLEPPVRERLDDLHLVTAQAVECMSPKISGVHLLIELLQVEHGIGARIFAEHGFPISSLRENLRRYAPRSNGSTPTGFSAEEVEPALWAELVALVDRDPPTPVTDSDLTIAALRGLDDHVRSRLTQWLTVPLDDVIDQIRRRGVTVATMKVFADSGAISADAFHANAFRVLELAHREAQSLGHSILTPDLLALGMLVTDGILSQALCAQAANPKTLQENLLLNLRPRHRPAVLDYPLDREHFHSTAIRILEQAAISATQDGWKSVDESHLLRALVLQQHGLALQVLSEMDVDVNRLREFSESYLNWRDEDDAETEDRPDNGLPSVEAMEDKLRSTVIGQDAVIDRVLPLLKRLRFGYRRAGKPGGVFLLMGKSGTGKTMLAKALAEAVFGSPDNLLMLEMGQFKSDISINQFIGAPPGYVGYGEGKLTNGLRDNPECVVLFDEVEKASEQVYDALLRFLDEGLISDPAGPVRDGSRCLIVLTSNLGASELGVLAARIRAEGYSDEMQDELRERALSYFKKPELINRIDELILFNSLNRDDFGSILLKELLRDQQWLLKNKKLELTLDGAAVGLLTDWAFEREEEGARVVGKILTNRLISPMIDKLLSDGLENSAASVEVTAPDGSLLFDVGGKV